MNGNFYLTITCGECDEAIHHGPCLTLDEHNGLPAIPFDMAAQMRFVCEQCGAENYTGDFELYCEASR